MSEVEKKDESLEEVLSSPPAEEGVETPQEASPEKIEEKEPPKEESKIPEWRFKEINEELKSTRAEIQELKSKGKEEGLSEEEKRELAAKTYIEKTAREAYQKMAAEDAVAEAEREKEIAENIKFYNSIDKDFTAKVAEDIGNKYGTEKNPIPVEVAYNIFKNEKQLKSQIPTLKPKLPNPIHSTDAIETPSEKENKGKGFWQIVEEAKKTLKGQ